MNKRKQEKELAAAFGEMIKERYEAVQKRKKDAEKAKKREKSKLAGSKRKNEKELSAAFGDMIKKRYEAVQKRKTDAENTRKRENRNPSRKSGKLYIQHTKAGIVQSSDRPSQTTDIPKTLNDGASTSGSCCESEAPDIPRACNRVDQTRLRKVLDKITFTEGQPNSPPSQTRTERRDKRSSGWEARRPEIFTAFFREEAPPFTNENCVHCNSNPATMRCEDGCGTLCVTCDALKHKFLATHVRHTWVVAGFKTTLKPCQTLVLQQDGSYCLSNDDRAIPARLIEKNCKNCGSVEVERIIDIPCKFVSVQGQQDVFLPAVKCHSCTYIHKVDWENLVASNYFAGSSSIYEGCNIFSTETLRTFFFLRMDSPQLSVRAFLASLQRLSKDLDARVISPIAFKDAFEEWVRCMSGLNGFVDELKSVTHSPIKHD